LAIHTVLEILLYIGIILLPSEGTHISGVKILELSGSTKF